MAKSGRSTMLKISRTSNLLQYWLQCHLMIQPCTKRTVFEVWPWRDRPWLWMSQDNLLREYHYTERWAAKRTDKFNWYASINVFIIHSVAIIMLFIQWTKIIRRDWIVKDCKVPLHTPIIAKYIEFLYQVLFPWHKAYTSNEIRSPKNQVFHEP